MDMKSKIMSWLLLCACLFFAVETLAVRSFFRRSSSRLKPVRVKMARTKTIRNTTYKKKAPLNDFGKPSKSNRIPKTKVVMGHGKRTRKGYTYVNMYARSN